MAINVTTSSAIGTYDTNITLANPLGAAPGKFIQIDSERMKIGDVSNAPSIAVSRGWAGTAAVAHGALATACIGLPVDFPPVPAPRQYTYGAAGVLVVAPGLHILKGPAGSVAMTLAPPLASQNGVEMTFTAATAEAYTITSLPGGFNGGAAASDVATFNAIGDTLSVIAVNGVWNVTSNEGVVLA